jgi:hypothetical protein
MDGRRASRRTKLGRRSAPTTGGGKEAQMKILDFYYYRIKVRKSGEKVGLLYYCQQAHRGEQL